MELAGRLDGGGAGDKHKSTHPLGPHIGAELFKAPAPEAVTISVMLDTVCTEDLPRPTGADLWLLPPLSAPTYASQNSSTGRCSTRSSLVGCRLGQRVVQELIAAEMDVSRTPVREALLRLEAEGILESSGRGGFAVRSIPVDEARSLYELRAAVEGYAAKMVAERGDSEAIESIRKAVSGTAAGASSVESGFELNREVHRSIVVASGNSMFVEAVDSIWGRSQAFLMYAKLHAADLPLS